MKASSMYVSKDLNVCITHTIYSAGNSTTVQRQYGKGETVHLPLTLPVWAPNLLKSILSIHLQRLHVTDDSKVMYAGLKTKFLT